MYSKLFVAFRVPKKTMTVKTKRNLNEKEWKI
jgi:hypothetical protein